MLGLVFLVQPTTLILTRYHDRAQQPEVLAGREVYATKFILLVFTLLGHEQFTNGVQLKVECREAEYWSGRFQEPQQCQYEYWSGLEDVYDRVAGECDHALVLAQAEIEYIYARN